MKILIAEDDIIAEKVLRMTLRGLGHQVVSTKDGTAAWEAYQREHYRVIISDWMMPETDGLELCRRIRGCVGVPYTYFMLLTAAHTGDDDYSMAIGSGVDDFLTKPLNRDMIRSRLHVAERILRYTSQIQKLEEIIPMCCKCRKVRNDDVWERIESYITARSGSQFSHGLCPDCYGQQLTELEHLIVSRGGVSTVTAESGTTGTGEPG